MHSNRINNLLPATELKLVLMKQFLVVASLYFVEQVAFQGIIPLVLEYVTKNLYFTTFIDLMQQIVDLVIFSMLLICFRARTWPENFLIASFELGNLNLFIRGEAKNVKLEEVIINPEFLDHNFRSCKTEYEDLILNSVSEDSESGLQGLNVVLLNPSFEDSYDETDEQHKTAKVYSHLALGKKIKLKPVNQ